MGAALLRSAFLRNNYETRNGTEGVDVQIQHEMLRTLVRYDAANVRTSQHLQCCEEFAIAEYRPATFAGDLTLARQRTQ